LTGLAEAFAAFGAAGKNPRWSWSARTADNQTVVMTFWKDILRFQDNPISYSLFGDVRLDVWKDHLGNRERIDNIKWARDNCDGLMKVVIITAKDETAREREIAETYTQRSASVRLAYLLRNVARRELYRFYEKAIQSVGRKVFRCTQIQLV
jgi:hypothetical protein